MRQLGLAAAGRLTSTRLLVPPQQGRPRPLAHPPAGRPRNSQPPSSTRPASQVRPAAWFGAYSCWSPTPSLWAAWAKTDLGSPSPVPTTASCLSSGGAGLPGMPSRVLPLSQPPSLRALPGRVAPGGSEAWSRRPRVTWWPDAPAQALPLVPQSPTWVPGVLPRGLQCPEREGTSPR